MTPATLNPDTSIFQYPNATRSITTTSRSLAVIGESSRENSFFERTMNYEAIVKAKNVNDGPPSYEFVVSSSTR